MPKRLKTEIAVLLFLAALFFLSRFLYLTAIPIFGDEAIYLNWSQTMAEDIRQVFLPLSDGKQPLYMWLTAPLTYLPINPLVVARLVAVFSGFFSTLGIYFIGKKLISRKFAIFAAGFYIVTPMLFFYDRLGVPDGLLLTFGIWSLYFGLMLVSQPTWQRYLTLGVVLGLGLLAKSPAIFYVLLLPTLLVPQLLQRHPHWRHAGKAAGLMVVAGITGLLISLVLRLSPLYPVIAQRTNDFVFSPTHLLENPLDPFSSRIAEVWGWLLGYLTVPLVFFAFAGLTVACLRKQLYVIVIFFWFFMPLLLEMALAKGFTPRYFLFTIPPLIFVAAYGFYGLLMHVSNRKFLRYAIVLPLLVPLQFIYLLLTHPARAPIPQKERSGYLEDWTAGWGIAEVSRYIHSLPVEQKVLVGTEGRFGTLPDGLIDYTRRTPNLHVEGMGQPVQIDQIPQPLWDWLLKDRTNRAFLVVNRSRMKINHFEHLLLIAEYPKPAGPNGQDALLFFEVLR